MAVGVGVVLVLVLVEVSGVDDGEGRRLRLGMEGNRIVERGVGRLVVRSFLSIYRSSGREIVGGERCPRLGGVCGNVVRYISRSCRGKKN